LIKDLKSQVKKKPIDLSKIKNENKKYFNFLNFKNKDLNEKNETRNIIKCINVKNHESCCNFDNLNYEKEYNKHNQNFIKYSEILENDKIDNFSKKIKNKISTIYCKKNKLFKFHNFLIYKRGNLKKQIIFYI